MTLRKSSPMAASTAMTGDYVRITSPMGATFPMLGHRGDHLVNGAFGQVILRDEGRFLKLSEFMPAEIGALQEIQLKAATVVERLIVDDPKELALAGFDYLHKASALLKESLHETGQRQVLVAALQGDAQRIIETLRGIGYSVLEHVKTETVKRTSLYIAQDVDRLQQGLEDGEYPEGATVYAMKTESSSQEAKMVSQVDAISELLFARSTPSQPIMRTPVPELSPFMRQMVGEPNQGISGADLGEDDDEGDAPRM